jgi:AcrR family transcriptional regulator
MVDSTQTAILEGASRRFAHYGYAKTSMDDIAAEARVAKGTVYLYCANKQDLFYQAVARDLQGWTERLSSLIDPARPADQILADMGRADAAFVEERPLVADLLAGMLDGQLPALAERFAELRSAGLCHVVQVLELGVRQGIFDPDLDVVPTAQVLQDMHLAGALLVHRADRPLAEVRRQQVAALRLALRGLRP